jgi:ERCC4-type nuclease
LIFLFLMSLFFVVNQDIDGGVGRVPLQIWVDDREPDDGLVASLLAHGSVEVTRRRLSVGDYEVVGWGVFERKRLLDFVASIEDGRLFRQARRLAGLAMPAAIILEGHARDLAGCQMRRESLQGAMISLCLGFRLPVLRSQGPEETAGLIIYAGRQWQRQGDGFITSPGQRPKRKRTIQLRLLCGLPGIGPQRARKLLEHFLSPKAVFTATAVELQQVEGVGRHTAETIRWALEA